jgi:hypothetical protein
VLSGRQSAGGSPLVAVLDNEALQALSVTNHPKHRRMLAVIEAAAQRNRRRSADVTVMTTTAVRVEALVDHQSRSAVRLNALRVRDVALDPVRADRATGLRRHAGGSVVDATVGEAAAAAAGDGATVTVYTADVTDIRALADASGRSIQVVLV